VVQRISDCVNREGLALGLGVGEITLVKADQYYRKIIEQLKAENPAAIVHYYDFSERGTEDYYQKPNPGMPLHLWRHLKMANIEIDWGNSFVISHLIYSKSEVDPFGVIGTAPNSSDRLLAQGLNLRAIDAKEYFGWKADLTLQMGGCVQPLVKMGIKP
jgi:hypothetical protein